jgi:hypothetical protein
MPNDKSPVPITDEQAKAVAAVAETTGKGIEAASKFLSYWAAVFDTAPHDLFAYLIGDRLHHARIRRLFKILQRTEEILTERQVKKPEAPSESIATPLIAAARQESNEALQEMWAKLLATAMDPARRSVVSRSLIEIVHQMEPIDALVMEKLSETPSWSPNPRDAFAQMFKVGSDVVEMSFLRITRLGCARWASTGARSEEMPTDTSNVHLTATGRVLMSVVRG